MNPVLHKEVERLLGVARMHALIVITRPTDQRESYLARYRSVWVQYAAAFTASDDERQSFVDALDRATRELMVTIEAGDVAVWRAETDKWITQTLAAGATEPRHRPGDVISVEELGPVLRKIIGQ